LVAFGQKPSVHDVPNKRSTVKYKRYVEKVGATMRTLGSACPNDKKVLSKRISIVQALNIISKYGYYTDVLAFTLSIDGAFSRPEDQIFCILHLHKREIEKIITLLFTRSVDELNTDVKKKRVAHIELLQSHVNTLALGSVEKPGHWKCPVKNGEEVGDCSFTDGQSKQVEEQLSHIIDNALTLEASRGSEWKNVCKRMTWIMTTLRQREYLTYTTIRLVSIRIYRWMANWASLVGREGMTKYTHCMGVDHVPYFMKKWHNFYRYSNQGWEYFNSQYRDILPPDATRGGGRHQW
jgi:hypothetical protein